MHFRGCSQHRYPRVLATYRRYQWTDHVPKELQFQMVNGRNSDSESDIKLPKMSTKAVRSIKSLWIPDSTLASYLCLLCGCSHENRTGSEILPSQCNLSLHRLTHSPPCSTVCTLLSWALTFCSCPSSFTLTACCRKFTVTESKSTYLHCLLLNVHIRVGTKHCL